MRKALTIPFVVLMSLQALDSAETKRDSPESHERRPLPKSHSQIAWDERPQWTAVEEFIEEHGYQLVQKWCEFDAPPRRATASLSVDERGAAEVVYRRMHTIRLGRLAPKPRVLLTIFSDAADAALQSRFEGSFAAFVSRDEYRNYGDFWLRVDHLEILSSDSAFVVAGYGETRMPGGADLYYLARHADQWEIIHEVPLWIE